MENNFPNNHDQYKNPKTYKTRTNQQRVKLNTINRDNLNDRIVQLKESESLSLQNICDKLNEEKYTTPTGKSWDKPKLSSYYRTIKEKVPKKV